MKPDPIQVLRDIEWGRLGTTCPGCGFRKAPGFETAEGNTHWKECPLAACLALPQSEEAQQIIAIANKYAKQAGAGFTVDPDKLRDFEQSKEPAVIADVLREAEKRAEQKLTGWEPAKDWLKRTPPVPAPASADRVREALVECLKWADDLKPYAEDGSAIVPVFERARAALSATPEQGRVEERNPDYVYDKANWEYTSTWDDRDTLTEGLYVGEIIHAGTLYSGPDKWAARIDETEVRWFDTKEEAEAALAPRATTDHDGGAE